MKIRWSNCFWLVIPLLAWNIALAPNLTLEEVISDAHSPAWLLAAENLTRIVVFAFPLLLAFQVKDRLGKTGLAIYLAGLLIYFASWVPLVWTSPIWLGRSDIAFAAGYPSAGIFGHRLDRPFPILCICIRSVHHPAHHPRDTKPGRIKYAGPFNRIQPGSHKNENNVP